MRCVRQPPVGCSRRAKIQPADLGIVKEVGRAILDTDSAELKYCGMVGHSERGASVLLDE